MLPWIVVFACASSRLFASGQCVDPSSRLAWLFVGLAIFAASVLPVPHFRWSRFSLCAAFVAGVAALALGAPTIRPAGWLLTMAAPIVAFRRVSATAARVGAAMLFTAVILVVQEPMQWMYDGFTARNPDCPGIAPLLALLVRGLGGHVGTSGEAIFVGTLKYNHVIPTSWNHLAIFPSLLIFVGGAAVIAMTSGSGRRLVDLAKLLMICAFYPLVRFAMVLAIFLSRMLHVVHNDDRVHVEMFWLPTIVVATYAPIVLFLGKWCTRRVSGEAAATAAPVTSRPAHVWPWAAFGALAFVFGAFFQDPGVAKEGRVLIDEVHSPWEKSTRSPGTEWYGTEAGYNYWGMADYLDRHFSVDRVTTGVIDEARLERTDVLILKTPTDPYTPEEVDAIERFVRRGGGLFLLGEHSNVFGSGVCLNAVARRFGLAFRPDCVFDIERKWEEVWLPPKNGRHAAAVHAPFFQFAVSCSIRTSSWTAQPVFRGEGLWTLPIDYKTDNFYPEVLDHTYAHFGAFDQAVADTAGSGRVLAFGDSTVFSNFAAFQPGRIDFLLDAVSWLNRKNRWSWVNLAGFGLATLAAGIVLMFMMRGRLDATTLLNAVAATTLATLLTQTALDAWTRDTYPRAKPVKEIVEITFDIADGSYELPLFGFTKDFEHSYDTFTQWVLRCGYFPRVTVKGSDAWDLTGPVMLINPLRPSDAKDIERARRFVEKGGTLCVLDRPDRDHAGFAAWVGSFGLSIPDGPPARGKILEATSRIAVGNAVGGNDYVPGKGSAFIEGGTPLLVAENGGALLAWKRHGAGIVIAGGIAELFANPGMGGEHNHLPNANDRERFELEFTLLRALTSADPTPAFRAFAAAAVAVADLSR